MGKRGRPGVPKNGVPGPHLSEWIAILDVDPKYVDIVLWILRSLTAGRPVTARRLVRAHPMRRPTATKTIENWLPWARYVLQEYGATPNQENDPRLSTLGKVARGIGNHLEPPLKSENTNG